MLDLSSLSLVKTLWHHLFINDECTGIDTLSEIEQKQNNYTFHIYMAETESDQWSCNATSEIDILLTPFKPKTVKFSATVCRVVSYQRSTRLYGCRCEEL